MGTCVARVAVSVAPRSVCGVTQANPFAGSPSSRRLYVAFKTVGRAVNPENGATYEVLSAEPGPAHAVNVRETYEKDPWTRTTGTRHPHFYGDRGPSAVCGSEVLVALPMDFDADDPDACPTCADKVRAGEISNRPPRPSRALCTSFLRRQEDDGVRVYECRLLDGHRAEHRAAGGATWSLGEEDFTPEADGWV